jgi:hypothetical protein
MTIVVTIDPDTTLATVPRHFLGIQEQPTGSYDINSPGKQAKLRERLTGLELIRINANHWAAGQPAYKDTIGLTEQSWNANVKQALELNRWHGTRVIQCGADSGPDVQAFDNYKAWQLWWKDNHPGVIAYNEPANEPASASGWGLTPAERVSWWRDNQFRYQGLSLHPFASPAYAAGLSNYMADEMDKHLAPAPNRAGFVSIHGYGGHHVFGKDATLDAQKMLNSYFYPFFDNVRGGAIDPARRKSGLYGMYRYLWDKYRLPLLHTEFVPGGQQSCEWLGCAHDFCQVLATLCARRDGIDVRTVILQGTARTKMDFTQGDCMLFVKDGTPMSAGPHTFLEGPRFAQLADVLIPACRAKGIVKTTVSGAVPTPGVNGLGSSFQHVVLRDGNRLHLLGVNCNATEKRNIQFSVAGKINTWFCSREYKWSKIGDAAPYTGPFDYTGGVYVLNPGELVYATVDLTTTPPPPPPPPPPPDDPCQDIRQQLAAAKLDLAAAETELSETRAALDASEQQRAAADLRVQRLASIIDAAQAELDQA